MTVTSLENSTCECSVDRLLTETCIQTVVRTQTTPGHSELAILRVNWPFYTANWPFISQPFCFVTKLKHHLTTLGINHKAYSSHSFRRGGASFAYQSGILVELIKALGDWRSDAVLMYLTMPLSI